MLTNSQACVDSPRRTDFPFWQSFPIRAADMDARGHVNNANYLTFFEIARRAFFHANRVFAELEDQGQHPVLKTQTCTYHAQLRYPAILDIGLRVAEIRDRSFRFDYALFRANTDELLADGHTTHVWLHAATENAAPLPPSVIAALNTLVSRPLVTQHLGPSTS